MQKKCRTSAAPGFDENTEKVQKTAGPRHPEPGKYRKHGQSGAIQGKNESTTTSTHAFSIDALECWCGCLGGGAEGKKISDGVNSFIQQVKVEGEGRFYDGTMWYNGD